MTGAGTTGDAARRPGLSVRVRITALVALLVTVALAGAGLIVFVIEAERVENSTEREVEQELDEFVALRDAMVAADPDVGTRALLTEFLRRNVPDDDELLVAWVGDRPVAQFPADPLVDDPAFREAVAPLVTDGGTTYLSTPDGEVRVRSQPVTGDADGALLVATYLAEDRAELLSTMRTYAITAGVSALLITLAAGWLAGRLLLPLRTLRHTAEEISATDLSRRIPEATRDDGSPTRRDDVTALTHTVNGMLDRLEAAFTGQRQFLDDAGHELRTPLTVLRGHLELLDPDDPVEVAETRALLVDEVDRMARLVGDLILLAKSDRPDFLALGESDPDDLVATVLAKARALGDRSWVLDPATGSAAGSAAAGPLLLDEQRITQALLQLADNAVKHTAPGAEIGIGTAVSGGTVRYWVRDTGRGVPDADRDRIFERFGRSRVPDQDEGFGLGLSIVAAIAAAHGGRAFVTDPPSGPGACFVLALPAVRPLDTLEV
ncbi:sensor histidine kinase [Nocardioides sambongensis]|uniref:sensor histidine kinase n=1 Tax=Nocardioides sambongensis TaxID=2589074 RepID=UPI001E2EF239|nr:HAMP domain-containing sensor histidine kinase [Nocardioides sambongensis]